MVENGLKILLNLTHRGAVGADPLAGDGAGMLVQIPHEFFAAEAARLGFALPEPGQYGVGQLFMPREAEWRQRCEAIIEEAIAEEGQVVLGWRDVPVNNQRPAADRDPLRARPSGRSSSAAAPGSPTKPISSGGSI